MIHTKEILNSFWSKLWTSWLTLLILKPDCHRTYVWLCHSSLTPEHVNALTILRTVGNNHDPRTALPVILTMVPQSRPFKDGQESCSYDDVSFQYKYSSIQVLFPHSYKFHANRQQSFHEATGKRAWLKGRSPSMNTKSQKLVQMALARSEYIISTDAQKRCIPPPSQSCKLSFFKWREFSWELKSHCCSQLIPCLQLKIGELYMILFICFSYFLIVSIPTGIH